MNKECLSKSLLQLLQSLSCLRSAPLGYRVQKIIAKTINNSESYIQFINTGYDREHFEIENCFFTAKDYIYDVEQARNNSNTIRFDAIRTTQRPTKLFFINCIFIYLFQFSTPPGGASKTICLYTLRCGSKVNVSELYLVCSAAKRCDLR